MITRKQLLIIGLVVGDDKASQSELDRTKTEAERTAAVLRPARYRVAPPGSVRRPGRAPVTMRDQSR